MGCQVIGTPGYVAPEVVLGIPYNETSDLWSLGVVMYMLFTKRQPFEHNDLDEAYPEVSFPSDSTDCVV